MTLIEYAVALEKSRRPGDAAVARYIRENRLSLQRYLGRFSKGLNREDREELLQVALLACVEAVRAPDAETALKNVHNAMQRTARHAASWEKRKSSPLVDEKSRDELQDFADFGNRNPNKSQEESE